MKKCGNMWSRFFRCDYGMIKICFLFHSPYLNFDEIRGVLVHLLQYKPYVDFSGRTTYNKNKKRNSFDLGDMQFKSFPRD